jgi:hypothetical protein
LFAARLRVRGRRSIEYCVKRVEGMQREKGNLAQTKNFFCTSTVK